MSTALTAWHDMVEGEVARDAAAVLTGVAVTGEHFDPGQATFVLGTAHALRQADDRGNGKRG